MLVKSSAPSSDKRLQLFRTVYFCRYIVIIMIVTVHWTLAAVGRGGCVGRDQSLAACCLLSGCLARYHWVPAGVLVKVRSGQRWTAQSAPPSHHSSSQATNTNNNKQPTVQLQVGINIHLSKHSFLCFITRTNDAVWSYDRHLLTHNSLPSTMK